VFFAGTLGHDIEGFNRYFVFLGRKPIKALIYNRYRKPYAAGFFSHTPIDRFDCFQTLWQIEMAADRRRYTCDKDKVLAGGSRDGEIGQRQQSLIDRWQRFETVVRVKFLYLAKEV